jgi:hypothetical protein
MRARARDRQARSPAPIASTDVTAPEMTAFEVPETSDTAIVVFTTPPAATGGGRYIVTVDTDVVPPWFSVPGAAWTDPAPTQSAALADGLHTFRAYSQDAARNISTPIVDTCTVSVPQ